ncbi:hypothetical protein ACQKO5_12645 [Novosphingobium subterraneum]|uniref:hypothetical protein n=1 Tax=Novosphingobium subterraneum TaxID=48936 RepID=UPI003D032289
MGDFVQKRSGSSPIDRLRNGGGSAEIPPGLGKIVSMKGIGNRIYFIAEKGVSSAVWADHIDPERTNPDIPLMVQRVELSYGSETEFIRRTLCASFALLDQTYLPRGLDIDGLLALSIRAASSFCSVSDAITAMTNHQDETKSQKLSGGYLPSTPNFQNAAKQCLGDLRDIECAIKEMCFFFYPKKTNKSPWDTDLKFAINKSFSNNTDAIEAFEKARNYLEIVADHRHSAFHEDRHKRVIFLDYTLDKRGFIVCPTIEVIHPKNPSPRCDFLTYLNARVVDLAHIFELFLGWLCQLNVKSPHDAFVSHVVSVPPEQAEAGSTTIWKTSLKAGLSMSDGKIGPVHGLES